MAIYPVPPSERYPQGGFKVVVTVWAGGKKEETLSVSDYSGKRAAQEAAKRRELDLKDELKKKRTYSRHMATSSLKCSAVKTFADIMEFYKSTPVKKGKNRGKERTFAGDMSRYNRLIDDLGKCAPWEVPDQLTIACTSWLDDLELEPATVNRHITMAKCAMRAAHQKRIGEHQEPLIPHNYLSDFPLYDENNIRFRILSDQERKDLWKALGEICPSIQKLYYMALCCPIRMSELVNIKVAHTKQIDGCISLPETKAGPARIIPIPEGLRDHIRRIGPGIEHVFHDGRGEPLGYPNKEGRIIFDRYRPFRAALAKAKIQAQTDSDVIGYNFHKTRQEAAMLLWQEGKPEDEIMLLGGWYSREAFLRYFDRSLALRIRAKQFLIGTEWKSDFAEDLRKAA